MERSAVEASREFVIALRRLLERAGIERTYRIELRTRAIEGFDPADVPADSFTYGEPARRNSLPIAGNKPSIRQCSTPVPVIAGRPHASHFAVL